jgi:hypothetical protein
MSLTNSSALRSVKDDGKTPLGSEGVPAVTVMEQVDAIMDQMFGPTAYSGVAKLNRAAEYCSDRAMIAATEMGGAQECENYAQACLILQTLADSLDAYLVESFLEADHA